MREKPGSGSGQQANSGQGSDAEEVAQPVSVGPSSEAAPDEAGVERVALPSTLGEVVDMLKRNGGWRLATAVKDSLKIVEFGRNRIVFEYVGDSKGNVAEELQQFLSKATKTSWSVRAIDSGGQAANAEKREDLTRDDQEALTKHELTRSVLKAFPGSKIDFGNGIGAN